MRAWVFLMAAIVCEVIGTTVLRDTDHLSRLAPSVVMLVAYAGAFYFMSLAADDLPIGLVYTVWSAVGIVLIFGISAFRYGEVPDLPALAGAGLVMLGVGLMSFGSSMAAAHQ